MREIRKAYRVFGVDDAAQLDVHPEGHVFVLPTALTFLERYLR